MKSKLRFTIALSAISVCSIGAVAAGASTGTEIDPVTIYWGSKAYPQTAMDGAHQGTATVKVRVVAGKIEGPGELVKSSRSPLLDEAALALIPTLTFKPAKASDAQPDTVLLVPVEFVRDSYRTIWKKPCRELSTDVEYFKKVFPEQKLTEMRVYLLALGLLPMQSSSFPGLNPAAHSAVMKAAFATCEAEPDRVLGEAVRDAAAQQR
jgi:TonB family protein